MKRRIGLGCRVAAMSLAALGLVTSLAHACAVCGGGNPANRFAFFASTITLSLIPLGMFGASFLWLRKRIRMSASDEFRERGTDTSEQARPERLR